MSSYQQDPVITIKGKPAIAIILLIVIFLLWRVLVTHDTVDPEVEELLRRELSSEYTRYLLPSLKEGVATRDETQLKKDVSRLNSYTKGITFPSLQSRGGGDNFYVRVEILVDGKTPPTGKSLRYFRLSRSLLLGYVFQEEAWALEYYLPFMS